MPVNANYLVCDPMDSGPLPADNGDIMLGTMLKDPKNILSSLSTIDRDCVEQYPEIIVSEASNRQLEVGQTQYMGRQDVAVRFHCPMVRLERFNDLVAREELVRRVYDGPVLSYWENSRHSLTGRKKPIYLVTGLMIATNASVKLVRCTKEQIAAVDLAIEYSGEIILAYSLLKINNPWKREGCADYVPSAGLIYDDGNGTDHVGTAIAI
ncbi:hypothetical protein VFPPC_11514 [Pochonia chlamydosporia 170]|uniref:Uncharacterized protein n=1 Tax=Pochonia chlamydosporia 170 TaxID=1380566 RepID=A0A179F0P8_METCM|nr:hypothetical protein VFPPC_11514 [Pochonia chlamydosporia 170]OAQ59016.1 hypothetical protein VFPPC_11514 [Pochonia chlamydosporia 170]